MKTVLYLDMWIGERIQERKLAGIRRFARTAGWDVVPVDEVSSRPTPLRRLLDSVRPVGVIIECSAARTDLPPSLFGEVPVVYLDCQRGQYGRAVTCVVHDVTLTVRTVFRELASNRPVGYAFVGYRNRRAWSDARARAFRTLVRGAGKVCRTFAWKAEDAEMRATRLAAWVAGLPPKTAVFAANDETAREVARAAELVHRAIPRTLTLLGVDNLEAVCLGERPTLSSIQVDFERAGYLAASLLNEALLTHDRHGAVATFGVLMTLRRESTRGYGRREPRILDAMGLIRARACDGLTAREVVALIGGSRRLAELRFREAAGHSILDEIETTRLERVMQLLRDQSVSLPVVIAQSGYSTAAALRKAFRLRTGKSLLAWRAANA